ncbi:helix-turn-helix domain-containing protein [Chiayiivirga flava]|uniref:Transcriptional regulator with XRE-family HTH domain n=1 Tax=Chiayiivirga flava TaxID=659595 RepID=A0A7W8G1B6_9GAMM|nr:transcriptional regulator with XRE-family HTH domain [Chiayiivirga flava]
MQTVRELGEAVARYRRAFGLKQGDVAAQAGIAQETLSRFEFGKVSEFGSRKLLAVLAVLGMELQFGAIGAAARWMSFAANGPGSRDPRCPRKTWDPGKTTQTFVAITFGLPPREQASIVERIGAAMAHVAPRVHEAMRAHPGVEDIGKRMLFAWNEGLSGLCEPRTYSLCHPGLGNALAVLAEPANVQPARTVIGRSELMGE